MGAGPVGKQSQLLLFEAVFHVPTGAVKLFVEGGRGKPRRLGRFAPAVGGQVGDDETRVVAFG